MKKRGSVRKSKFQKRNYLVLVVVFSIALVVLFSYGIFQNSSGDSSPITGLIVGDQQTSPDLYQQLVDKAIEEQELYSKMTQNSAQRQKILVQIIAEQQKPKEPVSVADVAATPPPPPPPPVAPKECTDSDGKDYYTKGTVEILNSGKIGVDTCTSTSTGYLLKEKICAQNTKGEWVINFESIICDASCDGYTCPLSTKTAKCIETDNGKDTKVKGTTKYESTAVSMIDSCPPNGLYVTEYYCEDAVIKQESIKCDGGSLCSDGACVKK